MTDTTTPVHPGALYTYRSEGFSSTILTEVISVDASGIRCENHISSDNTPTTPPLAVVLDSASFGETGEYVYAGDVRDHKGNPDVGDLFAYDPLCEDAGSTLLFDTPCVVEIVECFGVVSPRAIVRRTAIETGVSYAMTVVMGDLTRSAARWVGTTRPVYDTPERYAV